MIFRNEDKGFQCSSIDKYFRPISFVLAISTTYDPYAKLISTVKPTQYFFASKIEYIKKAYF